MTADLIHKLCLACSKPIKGRTDKKFCDDNCRNNYNNRLKAESNNLVRNINHALGKNRRILETLLNNNQSVSKVSYTELMHKGFHFKYFTHHITNKKGKIEFFCYDHGYVELNNNYYLILKG